MFFVVGTGRSGTKYMSRLLDIGHEATFTAEGVRHPMADDASVFALPYLDHLAGEHFILHVVREPRACIASLTPGPVFRKRDQHNKYRAWCQEQAPEVYGQPTAEKRATWWYWVINKRLEEYATERVRVEDITVGDCVRWAGRMGVWDQPILDRLRSLPNDVGTRAEPKPVVTHLPPEVSAMAADYGYLP